MLFHPCGQPSCLTCPFWCVEASRDHLTTLWNDRLLIDSACNLSRTATLSQPHAPRRTLLHKPGLVVRVAFGSKGRAGIGTFMLVLLAKHNMLNAGHNDLQAQ